MASWRASERNTIVRKVIWDGVNAHVVLFGVQDDEIEYPEIASVASDNTDDEDENEDAEKEDYSGLYGNTDIA